MHNKALNTEAPPGARLFFQARRKFSAKAAIAATHAAGDASFRPEMCEVPHTPACPKMPELARPKRQPKALGTPCNSLSGTLSSVPCARSDACRMKAGHAGVAKKEIAS
jgi:hypothetical protein